MFKGLDKITFCIKTFERPFFLQRLIDSIRTFYSSAKILVADDSLRPLPFKGVHKYLSLPFDIGLSEGRNILAQETDTEYMLILEDDFVFLPQTKIEIFFNIIENSDLNIIGGEARRYPNWKKRNPKAAAILEKKDEGLYFHCKVPKGKWDRYETYDYVNNFFVTRTKTMRDIPWPSHMKMLEHAYYFYIHREKLKVGFTGKVLIHHLHNHNKGRMYKAYRYHREDAHHHMIQAQEFGKLGIKYFCMLVEGKEPEIVPLVGNDLYVNLSDKLGYSLKDKRLNKLQRRNEE